MIDNDGKEFEGYVNSIQLPNGKRYKLQCEVVEVYPMTVLSVVAKLYLNMVMGIVNLAEHHLQHSLR